MSAKAPVDDVIFNHKAIDTQHRDLIELGSTINQLFINNESHTVLLNAFTEYHNILSVHFSCEESLIRMLPAERYADQINAHLKTHAAMLQFVNDMLTDISHSLPTAELNPLLPNLFDDFAYNIAVHDRELVGFLEAEGILPHPES